MKSMLFSLLLAFSFIPINLPAQDEEEQKYWIGIVEIFFQKGTSPDAIKAFLNDYGIRKQENFEYDQQAVINSTSDALILWRRSASRSRTQWRSVVTPFGQEERWKRIFETSPLVRKARRKLYDTKRGKSPEQLGLTVQQINTAKAAEITRKKLSLRQIEAFFRTKYKAYNGFLMESPSRRAPLRRVFNIKGLRGEVIGRPKYWEIVTVDVVLFVDDTNNVPKEDEPVETDIVLEGKYAPGLGPIAPGLNAYKPMQPQYQEDMKQYKKRLEAELYEFLNRSVP